MFKLAAKPTFTIPVEIYIPGQEAPGVCNVTFNYLPPDALEDWRKKFNFSSTVEAVDALVVNWDVVDSSDVPVPYNLENLTALSKQLHTVPTDFIKAYMQEIYGSRRKNS